MFFENRVPPKARDAYRKDTWSGVLGGVMTGLAFPFFAVIARDNLRASELEIALLTMAPVAGNVLLLVWASMMEGRRKMPFAVAAWVASRFLLIMILFATTSAVFVGIIVLFWIIASVAGPAYSALMKEIYPDGDRAKIMGYARVCTIFVISVFSLLAGQLLKVVSYRWLFPAAAIIGIVSVIPFSRIPTNEATGESDVPLWTFVKNSISILRKDKRFRLFCDGIFIFGTANFMAAPIYTIYQVDVLHVETGWASVYAVLTAIAGMFGYFFWGGYIDRKSPMSAVALCTLLGVTTPLAYCFATKAWMLIPIMVIAGVINSGADLAYFNGILHHAPKDRIAQYQSMFAGLMGVRGIIAPLLGAWLVRSHFGRLVDVFVPNSEHAHAISTRVVFVIAATIIFGAYIFQLSVIRRYGAREPM